MNKKGQSISINTIIVAAIALAVLVVLFLIFTGRLGIFSKGVSETTNCDQGCKSAGYDGNLMASSSDGKNYNDCSNRGTPLPGYYVIDPVDGLKKLCCCTKNS